MQEIVRALETKREGARQGGGAARIGVQHAKGRLTARERLEVLLDDANTMDGNCCPDRLWLE